MKDRNNERWSTAEGPRSGPGMHDDVSDYGRSSEYGANFRDASQYGNDRQRFGSNDRRPSNFNERYQGNDSGVPYRQNRQGQDDGGGWYSGGGNERYGRDRDGRDNRFGFGDGGYRGESHFGSGNLYGSDNRYGGEQYGAENNWRGDRGRDSTNSANRHSGNYGMYGTSRGSLPDYDSSLYGSGRSARSGRDDDWHSGRDSGQRDDESMMQKVGRFFGMGPKGYKRSDSRIQEDVNDALMDDAYVDATHIEVIAKDGEVTLEGYVEDRETKRRAEDVVCRVRGVKDCHNHLRIRPMSQVNVDSSFATGDTTSTSSNGSSASERNKNRQNSVS